ncbi:MAG: hypothetical protein B7Y74_00955, partial [Novosphingobium sp. 35-62-5]
MGWAVLFAENDPHADDIEKALQPLIEHRAKDAGPLCKVLKGSDGYQAGVDAVTDGKTPDGHDYDWSKAGRAG